MTKKLASVKVKELAITCLNIHKVRKLYACFVDFRKAFDLVWHKGLLYKLRLSGVSGRFFIRLLRACIPKQDYV